MCLLLYWLFDTDPEPFLKGDSNSQRRYDSELYWLFDSVPVIDSDSESYWLFDSAPHAHLLYNFNLEAS